MCFDEHTQFDILYTITIDKDNFMSCSCGYVKQYLAPCVHIMSVLKEDVCLTADLFHIRWLKHYNYYFASESAETLATNVHKSLVDLLNLTQDEAFDNHGVYKGSQLGLNSFLSTPQIIALAPFSMHVDSRIDYKAFENLLVLESRSICVWIYYIRLACTNVIY